MPTQPGHTPHGLLTAGRRLPVLLLAFAAVAALTLAACFGDDGDDDDAAATPAGSLVTTTPAQATATSQPQLGGTLVPGSPSPQPTVTTSAQAPVQGTPQPVSIVDLVACGTEGERLSQDRGGGIPALTYKDVPEGTPILFPFEEGELRHVDAREGAILLVYDVEGVGVFSVQAAGSSTLDRLVARPVAGTVIGHFNGIFEEEETDAFEGYQLFAVAGTEELVAVGNQVTVGEPLELRVEDCLVLP